MSKQEKCHLTLGIPIVEASHTLENIDLRDDMCKLDFSIQRVQDGETAIDGSSVTDTGSVKRMTIIEAYAQRDNVDLWASEAHFLTMTDSSNLSLL